MRKLLTVLLSTLMILSLGVCASADGNYDVSVEATQNESGDLVISATGNDAQKLIDTIYEGDEKYKINNSNGILVTVGDNWSGEIQNIKDATPIITKNEDGKLVVAKDALVNGGFVNATNKLVFLISGKEVASTSVKLSGLNDIPTPNAVKYMSINYSSYIPAIGKKAVDPTVFATDENGNKIVQNSLGVFGRFSAYWTKKDEEGNYRYVGEYKCDASDNCSWEYPTFEEGQIYYLTIYFNYIENMTGEKASTIINTAGEVSKATVARGATGTDMSHAFFICSNSSDYAIKYEAKHVYDYSYNIENADKIWLAGAGIAPTEDNAFVVEFCAKEGYSVPKKDDLTVTVGGVKITDFTYDTFIDSNNGKSTGHLCIDSKHVTGDVVINGKCVQNQVAAKVEGNAPKTSVEGTQEELNNKVELTQEEISQGAIISLKVNDSDTVETTDKSLVNKSLSGNTLGEVLNITLVKEVGSNETAVQPTSALKISVELKDSLINKDSSVVRTYSVIRVHGGQTETLPATYDEATKKVTFTTDKFSTYAIVYKDTKKETNTSSKYYDPKDKNQDGIITCDEEMNSVNWVWSTTKNACVYKVSNTSVR